MVRATMNTYTPVSYPVGCNASDCDYHVSGACIHPEEGLRNCGRCDGNKQDCVNWELCSRK